MISRETKDKILATADIVEIISEFVNLKKRGSNYVGLCPFHNEKTPSFVVSPAKGIFKCFGCGKAGDVVSFIMEHEKLSYYEALKFLAKKYGIEIEEAPIDDEAIAKQKLREILFNLNEIALKHFKNNLWNTDWGKSVALPYLLKERKIPEYLIEKFELGFAMSDGKDFYSFARSKGYKDENLSKAGLIVKKSNGYTDRFVNRIIFPIHNITGKIIGFGGRVLGKAKDTAKYLNTPETEIFQKRDNLYGLYFAKKHIISNDKCYLVEGYTDVIGLFRAGVENVVASLGTSLTTNQIITLRRFSKNLTIVYDGDFAGIKASLRGIDLALEEGMNVRIVALPEGEDPDSITTKWTASQVVEYLKENEQDFIKYKAKFLLKETQNDPYKKSQAIHEILVSVASFDNPVTRGIYIKEISGLLNVEEEFLYDELNKILYNKYQKQAKQKQKIPITETDKKEEKKTPSLPTFISNIYYKPQEEEIIKILLKYGDKTISIDGQTFKAADIVISELKGDNITFSDPVFGKIYEEYLKGNTDIDYFINHQDSGIREVAANILFSKHKLSRIFENYNIYTYSEEDMIYQNIIVTILLFKKKILEIKRDELIKELADAENENDEEKILNLMNKITQINSILKDLTQNFDWLDKGVN